MMGGWVFDELIVEVEQPFGAVWQPRNFRSLGRGQEPEASKLTIRKWRISSPYKGTISIQSGPVPKGPHKLVTGVGTTPPIWIEL